MNSELSEVQLKFISLGVDVVGVRLGAISRHSAKRIYGGKRGCVFMLRDREAIKELPPRVNGFSKKNRSRVTTIVRIERTKEPTA
jgi:hypothetical protein